MAGPSQNNALLNVKQVAARLHVSERTVWSMVSKDTLPPPLHLGRLRRWEPEIIEAHLRAKRAEATRANKSRLTFLPS